MLLTAILIAFITGETSLLCRLMHLDACQLRQIGLEDLANSRNSLPTFPAYHEVRVEVYSACHGSSGYIASVHRAFAGIVDSSRTLFHEHETYRPFNFHDFVSGKIECLNESIHDVRL